MIRVAIAYPSTARIALQSLSIHIIRKILGEYSNVYTDFVFMGNDGRSITKQLRDFDIVIFSVHYELDYPRILKMMEVSGINPFGFQRTANDPLIVMGGPTLMANPEPMSSFADIILIGDAEVLIPTLIDYYMEYGKNIEEYANLVGFYVPSLGKHTVTKAFVRDLSYSIKLVHDTAIELSYGGAKSLFNNLAVLEVMRGCPRSCLFCMEGFVSRPVRFADVTAIKDLILRDVNRDRKLVNGVTLVGLSVTDHPGFKELMNFLVNDLGLSVSSPSLRVDSLDRDAIRLIAGGGQKVLTIAPESSERLRRALGKGFSDDDIARVAMDAIDAGINHLKLYFMVGLPGEIYDDINSITNLLLRLRRLGIKFSLSVNPWVPKPHTPLQWLPMAGDDVINDRVKALREIHTYTGFSTYSAFDAKVQALLSLGDRDISDLIFEASLTSLDRGSWRRLLRKYEGLLSRYVYSWKSLNSELPWSHIRIPGIDEGNLKSMLLRYVKEVGIDLPTQHIG
ncbi:B12-binding domain-containing radical SAM protein [Vulcanisaeta souniana]|nr:radical SAM protein [Vulcanisaeta souniana]